MKDNKHVQAILEDILPQAQTKIDEVKTLLAPSKPHCGTKFPAGAGGKIAQAVMDGDVSPALGSLDRWY
jgi:hypothetical protein